MAAHDHGTSPIRGMPPGGWSRLVFARGPVGPDHEHGGNTMSARVPALRLMTAGLLSFALAIGGVAGSFAGIARADSAPLAPTNPATPVTAAADALPTVQINGVVWAQVVVGNTVYAAGQFTRA